MSLVPAEPGLWHAAFLKINTTVFPFSSPACEPLQLLYNTTSHTNTHTHTCISCLVSLIRVIICCSQFSMDVSLHVMVNNHVHTFFLRLLYVFNFYSVLALNEIHKKVLLFIRISEVISDEVSFLHIWQIQYFLCLF